MGNIPIDIAADILSRSPAKSLARFASVSKAWASLISDPNFAKLHCNHHLQNLKLIARYGRLYSLDLDSLDCALRIDYLLKDSDFTVNKVLGLSDHLLCLSVSSESNPNPNPDLKSIDFDNGIIVICNLSTGARHIVPPSPVEFPPSSPVEFSPYLYDRHDLKKRFSYGFGFDPSSDDYKLVRISPYGDMPILYHTGRDILSEIKVYSMKTKSWSVINDRDISRFPLAPEEPVALDGVLYWATGCNRYFHRYNLIVAFDLAVGSFRRVPPPTPHSIRSCCLLSLGGKLCVMCDMFEFKLEDFKFYKMEECGDSVSWTPLASFWCDRFFYDKAVTFSKNGDRVLVEQQREDKFVCFDLAKETTCMRRVEFFSMEEGGNGNKG